MDGGKINHIAQVDVNMQWKAAFDKETTCTRRGQRWYRDTDKDRDKIEARWT